MTWYQIASEYMFLFSRANVRLDFSFESQPVRLTTM